MFAINSKVCNQLQAKKKWKKEDCIFCSMPVNKCKKLQEDIRRREEENAKFDETREMARMPGDFEENELT